MAINSKRKGSSAERDVAKIFSNYLGGSFIRVPSSGAYVGGKNSLRKDTLSKTQIRASKSDIIPPDEFENLVIEVKSYKDLSYHNFATSQDVILLDKWFKELEHDCDVDDFGILCFKTNKRKWTICIKKEYLNKFDMEIYTIYKDYFLTGMENFLENNKENLTKIIKGEINA